MKKPIILFPLLLTTVALSGCTVEPAKVSASSENYVLSGEASEIIFERNSTYKEYSLENLFVTLDENTCGGTLTYVETEGKDPNWYAKYLFTAEKEGSAKVYAEISYIETDAFGFAEIGEQYFFDEIYITVTSN